MKASLNTCRCKMTAHPCKLIVITGGPGAGKTAALEIAKQYFCQHVSILPEAASILYGSGAFRRDTEVSRQAGQRAIYHIQSELERVTLEEGHSALGLCDRGTLDGLAYWTDDETEYWSQLGTSREEELSKYAAVIHMKTPGFENGYNHQNPIRIESAIEAMKIDQKIAKAWQGHPRVFTIESCPVFTDKVTRVLIEIERFLPDCCRRI